MKTRNRSEPKQRPASPPRWQPPRLATARVRAQPRRPCWSRRKARCPSAAGYPHSVLPLSGITHMASQEAAAENLLLLQLDFLRQSLGGLTDKEDLFRVVLEDGPAVLGWQAWHDIDARYAYGAIAAGPQVADLWAGCR
jgi:hypothetical protein